MNVLSVNVGSSSVKLSVLDDDDAVLSSADSAVPASSIGTVLEEFLETAPPIDAIGHRVVHGGSLFTEAVMLGESVNDDLDRLAELAPLHNPPSTEAIRLLLNIRPAIPQVACFDTSFHAHMPPHARTYPIPRDWTSRWNIRRYGFHGLSHDWATQRAAELVHRPREDLRMVSAHIGSGASLAAVAGGRSVDTTMGFTPLEGLAMSTRSGTIDPGIVFWLQREAGLGIDQIEQTLETGSGLLGMSGLSGDLRRVIEAAGTGDRSAALAYDVYVHRIRTGIAAMAASIGGLDTVIFTGGAGERSARLRNDVCAGLDFLGITLDPGANDAASGDAIVSAPRSAVRVAVVVAREDRIIAQQVRKALHGGGPDAERDG